MYKYNPCASGIAHNKRSSPYVKPVVGRSSAILESNRVVADTCLNTFVNHVPVKLASGPIPPVPVQTTPASATITRRSQAVFDEANNPFVPATRFSQYFPAPPLPYIVPSTMRIRNNDPLPSTQVCQPLTRYQGTAASLAQSSN
jgi:hypothetical protein